MRRRSFVGPIIFLGLITAFVAVSRPNFAALADESMQQVAAGDHWTYEVKDEISGSVKFTRTDLVTDVTQKDIAVRVDFANTGRTNNLLYDHSWNLLRSGFYKYSPDDGTGFKLPLTVGAQWKFSGDVLNSSNGRTFKRTVNSKVTSQESITTKAGTFETFIIETKFTGKPVQDITTLNETSVRTWFSPDINHWVKRSYAYRQNGHLMENNTFELTEYGRKKE
jgi:hypothetical protein